MRSPPVCLSFFSEWCLFLSLLPLGLPLSRRHISRQRGCLRTFSSGVLAGGHDHDPQQRSGRLRHPKLCGCHRVRHREGPRGIPAGAGHGVTLLPPSRMGGEENRCAAVLNVYAVTKITEKDLNGHLIGRRVEGRRHWRNIRLDITPNGIHAQETTPTRCSSP